MRNEDTSFGYNLTLPWTSKAYMIRKQQSAVKNGKMEMKV